MSLEVGSFALDGPIVLAGAGKMGTALLSGWLARGLKARNVIVQEPHLSGDAAKFVSEHGIAAAPVIEALPSPPSVILLAVKPQTMTAALSGPRRLPVCQDDVVTGDRGERRA